VSVIVTVVIRWT